MTSQAVNHTKSSDFLTALVPELELQNSGKGLEVTWRLRIVSMGIGHWLWEVGNSFWDCTGAGLTTGGA